MAENKTIELPDVGDFQDIEIIEILVTPGDVVDAEQSIVVLESDKATMEIPSPFSGTIETVVVKVGDRLNQGDQIATLTTSGDAQVAVDSSPVAEPEVEAAITRGEPTTESPVEVLTAAVSDADEQSARVAPGKKLKPHPGAEASLAVSNTRKTIAASPSIRRYARELGVELEQVIGSGSKGRLVKADVKAFIKSAMSGGASQGGISVSRQPEIDFSKFGATEMVALSRIQKISGAHLHRSWVTVPHVTQFDDADITELESFRKSLAREAEEKAVRLTPLIFLMKAVVSALREFPGFNASLDERGENLVMKKYFHIGIAVDTPGGLVVPVVRNVDKKGLFELAAELGELSARARDGKLSPTDMQGGCFTISSLGGIGGTGFTPIINAPEVAILGVSRAKMQPVYIDGAFVPRLMLPLGLSYDHRVIDGAQAARFTNFLSRIISDIRRVLL